MASAVPVEFGEAFLDWFRERTESVWSTYPTPTLERFEQRRMLGCDWQPGTRWLGGLAEEQLAAIERAWALRFPPDYRLFLQRLHAVDRPMRCTRWYRSPAGGPSQLTLVDGPAFYNWLTDEAFLRSALEDVVSGLQFDVEQNGLWLPQWGERQATEEARAQRVRELVAAAPHLIPVYDHRYLLAEPCQAGNPVFSIVQSDIIVYGADLRTYLFSECADLLGIDKHEVRNEADNRMRASFESYATIPFWGDLYSM